MRLLILGASARAAAESAIRSGHTVTSIDLFADEDLRRIATAHRITASNYPGQLAGIARHVAHEDSCDAWIYTGGLENHPAVIDDVASVIPLLGNGADVLPHICDPERLSECFAAGGIAYPTTITDGTMPRKHGDRWLIKNANSCGGSGVADWSGQSVDPTGDSYIQAWVPGVSASASYVADGRAAHCLGLTRQLLRGGCGTQNSRPFGYAGSIGPMDTSESLRAWLRRFGDVSDGSFSVGGTIRRRLRNGSSQSTSYGRRSQPALYGFDGSVGERMGNVADGASHRCLPE